MITPTQFIEWMADLAAVAADQTADTQAEPTLVDFAADLIDRITLALDGR